ncbi:MAG: crossover junction endodeoxyribonuclease RuvC [Acidimicrobiales bacterium]
MFVGGTAGPSRVLGIDPGVSRCGYGTVERKGLRLAAVSAGVITTSASDPLPARLVELAAQLREVVAESDPEVVAVERVLFQANARTAMSVGQAAGLALVAAAEAGRQVVVYSANEVKQAVTGWGAADKAQVQRMVAVLLELEAPPRPADAADALALAVCHLHLARGRARVEAALDQGRGGAGPR